MIRKSMICVALASMALATSCSQDDIASGYALSKTPIKMNTSFGLSTRAVETTVANLGSFRVSAFQDGKDNYMSDVEYTSAGGTAWSASAGTYFWPASGYLQMYCYAPYQPGQQGTFTLNKDTQIFADFVPNTAAADQKDFVFAKATGSAAQNGSTGIDINFQHALSEITIAAKNSNKAYTVEVTGVKLGNIANKGTFTFPNNNISALWTLSDPTADKQDYTTTWATPVALGDDATTMDAANVPFMLLPQQLKETDKASEGAYIAVKVKITMQGGTEYYNGWVYTGCKDKWEMGKHYAYTLDFTSGAGEDENGKSVFSGSDIKMNVSVTPWDTEAKDLSVSPSVKMTADNCLIVNPASTDVYGIDVAQKINAFWSSSEGDGTRPIQDGVNWTAEVIWQDIPSRAINFCTKKGTVLSGDTFEGVGVQPLYIKADANVKGNIIIGIKKTGTSDYLWSYHLWLTDEPQVIEGFMDRNLGATSALPPSTGREYGIYYEFGRKDPFCDWLGLFYNINGNLQKDVMKLENVTATFAEAVRKPTTFYMLSSGAAWIDWVTDNKYADKNWNDIKKSKGKTFFDPCPQGYRIPQTSDFSDFSLETFSYVKDPWGGTYKGNWFPDGKTYESIHMGVSSFGAGQVWTSTPGTSTTSGACLSFNQNFVGISRSPRRDGLYVRCVKE